MDENNPVKQLFCQSKMFKIELLSSNSKQINILLKRQSKLNKLVHQSRTISSIARFYKNICIEKVSVKQYMLGIVSKTDNSVYNNYLRGEIVGINRSGC